MRLRFQSGTLSLAACLAFLGSSRLQAQDVVEFNRDIRPILSNNCFTCHGPDNNLRKAKLRLDQEEGALRVLSAGKPTESELYKRLVTTEAADRMPPAKSNKHLTKEQTELVRRWIEQGAKYQKHWSLLPPQLAKAPAVKQAGWAANPIDQFILARLEKEGVKPSPETGRVTLLRRLSFDLTGLPPTPQDVDAFVADKSANAYEKQVDRLLASKHLGERLAVYWLDVARYADTAGYHSDNHRDVTLYRDWVVGAFNRNLPFDQFTIDQLAGDLLPSATAEQKIASGYNRLLQTTEEGGAQPKEYTAKYSADRVRNFSTAWLGMTIGCCECHDHKFDPFTTKEFYKLASFFADIQERAVGRQDQTPILTKEHGDKLKDFDTRIVQLQKELNAIPVDVSAELAKWEATVAATKFKGLPKEIVAVLNVVADKRTPQQKEQLANHYRTIAPALAQARQKVEAAQKEKAAFQKSLPTTLVAMTGAPRVVRVLPRGNWLDDSGEIVAPGVPVSLPVLKSGTEKKRLDRVDLARWVASPDNPLTARVFVNRLWMLHFGQGLVKTLDDFGSQGQAPTHPELLDWLASDFVAHGWDVKRAIKQMVMSATYRQSSQSTPEMRQRDPYNQLVARQARFRLEAEFVRDNALAISGLLVTNVGGPTAKPYQPAGYWKFLNFPTREWANDKGDNQYRRGIYTYWQRTFLQPSLLAFDASTREECTVERTRSNTPQQALVLLNDPTYVEASRVFAERILRGAKDTPSRIQFAMREAVQRSATEAELKVLASLVEQHLKHYQQSAKEAQALLRVGDRPAAGDLPAPELAAWTSVARTILNLHETITRN